jgi:DNA-binding PadR family transcriptional regulator
MKENLTSTSYVVLGIIGQYNSCTSYDLKRTINNSIDCFWSFPHSQLYAEPEHLKAAGLVTEVREKGGRKRRIYTITEKGKQTLQEWLREPTEALVEIRDVALLKLYFGNLLASNDLRQLAIEQAEFHRQRLAENDIICAALKQQDAGFAATTLEMVSLYDKAAIAFWLSIANDSKSTKSDIFAEWQSDEESEISNEPLEPLAKTDESLNQSAVSGKAAELPDYLL